MSIPMIETGYKPQFSLGALYQGFNAGSADNAAQLANLAKEWELQKSRAEDPYKVLSSMYQGELDNAKMQSPDYIPWQMTGQIGQMKSQDAAGQLAQGLLPFKQKAEEAQLSSDATRSNLFGNMYKGIEQQHNQSLDPNVREAGGQRGFFLADTLSRVDPKVMSQERLLGAKLDSAEEIAALRAQQLREAAAAKTHITEPKYKEQLAQHQNNMAEYNYMVSQGQPISAEVYKKAYQSNEWLRTHEQMLQIANPANFQPKMDMGAMGVPQRPAPVQQANTNRPSLDAVQGSPAGTPNVIKFDNQGNRIQ